MSDSQMLHEILKELKTLRQDTSSMQRDILNIRTDISDIKDTLNRINQWTPYDDTPVKKKKVA